MAVFFFVKGILIDSVEIDLAWKIQYYKEDVTMRFEDYTYTRPNLDEVKESFDAAIEKFKNAPSS